MVANSIESYEMAEEMYNFVIYTEKADPTVIGLGLKHSQRLVDKKKAPILH